MVILPSFCLHNSLRNSLSEKEERKINRPHRLLPTANVSLRVHLHAQSHSVNFHRNYIYHFSCCSVWHNLLSCRKAKRFEIDRFSLYHKSNPSSRGVTQPHVEESHHDLHNSSHDRYHCKVTGFRVASPTNNNDNSGRETQQRGTRPYMWLCLHVIIIFIKWDRT